MRLVADEMFRQNISNRESWPNLKDLEDLFLRAARHILRKLHIWSYVYFAGRAAQSMNPRVYNRIN